MKPKRNDTCNMCAPAGTKDRSNYGVSLQDCNICSPVDPRKVQAAKNMGCKICSPVAPKKKK